MQEKLEGFIYRALEQTVRSIMRGAVHSNWFPEVPVSDQVSSYMEQLVLLLQARPPLNLPPFTWCILQSRRGGKGETLREHNQPCNLSLTLCFLDDREALRDMSSSKLF